MNDDAITIIRSSGVFKLYSFKIIESITRKYCIDGCIVNNFEVLLYLYKQYTIKEQIKDYFVFF